MSFLAAFLGGAMGPGVQDVVQRGDRLDAEARAERRRLADKDEERAFRAAESEKERQGRKALLDERLGAGKGGLGGSRSGAGGGVLSMADAIDSPQVVGAMMKDGTDMAAVRSRIAGSAAGANGFTRNAGVVEQFDDGDRMRNVASQQTEPDPQAYVAFNQRLAQALMDAGPRSRSNFNQVTQGEGNRRTQGYVQGYVDTGNQRQAEGALLGSKRDLVTNDGTSAITGQAPAGSVAASKVRAEDALAGRRNEQAAGDRDKREGNGSLREQIQFMDAQRKSLSSSLQDARATEKTLTDAGFRTTPEQKAAATATRQKLEQRDEALQRDMDTLRQRLLRAQPAPGRGVLSGASGDEVTVTPQAQAARDAEAGRMILQEDGGPATAPSRLKTLRDAARMAPNAETRQLMTRDADMLERAMGAGAAPAAAPQDAAQGAPPINLLKNGVVTRFKNGQSWTLKGGKPVQVQ